MILDESLLITKSNIKKFDNKKLKKHDDIDISLEGYYLKQDEDFINEGAKISILPRFKSYYKKYPEMKEYESLIKEAENVLRETDTKKPDKYTAAKIGKNILHFLACWENLASILRLPFCFVAKFLMLNLLSRFFTYCFELGEFKLAENNAERMLTELKKIRNTSKEKEVQKTCDRLIEKIEENKKKLRESNEIEDIYEYLEEEYSETVLDCNSMIESCLYL